MKRTKIFSLWSNGVNRVRSLRKIPTRLHGTNISQQNPPPHWTLNSCFGVFRTIGCVQCEKFRRVFVARTFELVRTVLHQFCKETKRSQMVLNATKHEFSVQWGRSGAFIAKNSEANSWHEHFATKAPDPPHWTLNSCFGVFRTIGCVR